MKLGIFGGTFDPPHIGHLIAAEHVRQRLSLSKVFFVPASVPPHKRDVAIESGEHRIAMLRLATRDNLAFDVSDIELKRGGVSYTVDTLEEYTELYPSADFFLLLGMDNIPEFHTWKSPARILDLASLAIMTRPGIVLPGVDTMLEARSAICIVPEIGISSREIRSRVAAGESIRYMVPDVVEGYIREHNLYWKQQPH